MKIEVRIEEETSEGFLKVTMKSKKEKALILWKIPPFKLEVVSEKQEEYLRICLKSTYPFSLDKQLSN